MDIKVTTADNQIIVAACKAIARENHVDNGGTLHLADVCDEAKYIVYAEEDDAVIGYVSLVDNWLQTELKDETALQGKRELYIDQMAITKAYQQQGLGAKLIRYVVQHAKNYDIIAYNVQPTNANCLKFQKAFNTEKLADSETYGHSYFAPVPTKRAVTTFEAELPPKKLSTLQITNSVTLSR